MITKFDTDIVVIGAGGGGAVAAHALVNAGYSVIALEAGGPPPLEPPDEIVSHGPMKYAFHHRHQGYFSGIDHPDLNDSPHVYENSNGDMQLTKEGWTAVGAGGGTNLYGGVSIRFSPQDFERESFASSVSLRGSRSSIHELRRDVKDWPITASDMERYYLDVERSLGISGGAIGQEKPGYSEYGYQPAIDSCPRRWTA